MKQTLLIALLIANAVTFAQTTQKGWVTKLNSGKKAVAGVQVIFYGAPPTDTDGEGNFNLKFKTKKPGDLIVYDKIYKKAYEIVNEKELRTAKLSNYKLKIVLAAAGTVAQLKAEYYDISIAALTAGHDRQINKLKKQLGESKINEEKFVGEQRRLQEELENAKKHADELAEQFARTNFDDVGELYKRAFEQFKLGEIQKAIDILNEKDLIAEAQKVITDKQTIDSLKNELALREEENLLRRDTLMRTLKLKAELYSLQFEYQQADTVYHQLWLLDTTNIENTSDYADFLRERKQYDKAILFYNKLLKMDIEDWLKAYAYGNSGVIYMETGKFDEALSAYKKNNEIYEKLHNSEKSNTFYTNNLAISYSKLGEIYQSLGEFDKALEFYTLRSKLGKELYESNPKNESLKNGLAISYEKLGSIYQSLGEFDKALEFYTLMSHLFEELYESNPKNESLKNGLAISYSKLGSIYQSLGEFDKALEFYTLRSKLGKELYESNPKNINIYYGLGVSYDKLARLYKQTGDKENAIKYFKLSMQVDENMYKQTGLEKYKKWANSSKNIIEELSKTNADRINELKEQINQLIKEKQTAKIKTTISFAYGNLSWYYLFEKQFAEAETSARKALEYDKTQEWVKTNLAHALLFQGKDEAAEKIYKEMKNKPYTASEEYSTFGEVFHSDLQELEEAGITHKDVKKIRKLLE
ncbi:MAG: tetratricopeptide repeat protein [Bacteroidota bacterium]|nr:tetratricopeptide repeat protein [Bacteroidota bacterium]